MTWIDRCVKSLFASSLENDIYIVDNGSNDGTKDYIKTNYPFVKLFESDENLGFGKANNIGLTYEVCNKTILRLVIDILRASYLLNYTFVHDNDSIRH